MEVMIATVILALAVGSGLTLMSQCTAYTQDTRLRAKSSQVLQEKMEGLRLLSWTNLQSLPATFSSPEDTNGLFSGKISTSTYETYGSTATVMRVTLQVTWTNMHNYVVTNSLMTLISNGGLNGTGS